MPKKFNSKYYLKKEVSYLIDKLVKIKMNFEIFKDLKLGEEKKYITDNIPNFSVIVLAALSKNVLLELSKIVVDTPDFKGYENICITNLIEKYNNDKSIFKLKKYCYVTCIDDNKKYRRYLSNQDVDVIMKKLSKKIDKQDKIYKFLKKIRHKDLAHNDKAFGFKVNKKVIKEIVTYQEIEDYINELYDNLNELNRSLFSISTVCVYQHKDELKWLSQIVKNYKENIREQLLRH